MIVCRGAFRLATHTSVAFATSCPHAVGGRADRGHGTRRVFDRIGNCPAPRLGNFEEVPLRDRAGSGKRNVFAVAVAGDHVRLDTEIGEKAS